MSLQPTVDAELLDALTKYRIQGCYYSEHLITADTFYHFYPVSTSAA